jgi:protein TonB
MLIKSIARYDQVDTRTEDPLAGWERIAARNLHRVTSKSTAYVILVSRNAKDLGHMFDSVLKKGNVPKNRFGTSTIISILVHGSLFALVFYLTTRPPPVKEDLSEVKFFAAAPPPPPPPPPPPKKSVTKTEKTVVKKVDAIIQPKEIPQDKPKEAEPQKEEEDSSEDEGVEGGVEGGVVGGVVGGVLGGVVGGTIGGTLGGQGTEVLPFGEGMTRPVVDVAELTHSIYSREAREAQVQGTMIVRCHVMVDGSVNSCRIIKTLPHLAEAVLARIQSMRLKPATFQGKPISIDYVFNFKFELPR